MTDIIRLDIDDAPTHAAIRRLLDATGPAGLRPAYLEIGEDLTESTKGRFSTSTAPDGTRWLANARATIERYVNRGGKVTTKAGRLNAKGQARAGSKRPLVDSGILADTIHYQVDEEGLVVGTNRYAGDWDGGAAVLHFGSKDGRIPPRPFLGLSDEDRGNILDVLNRHFEAAGRG